MEILFRILGITSVVAIRSILWLRSHANLPRKPTLPHTSHIFYLIHSHIIYHAIHVLSLVLESRQSSFDSLSEYSRGERQLPEYRVERTRNLSRRQRFASNVYALCSVNCSINKSISPLYNVQIRKSWIGRLRCAAGESCHFQIHIMTYISYCITACNLSRC